MHRSIALATVLLALACGACVDGDPIAEPKPHEIPQAEVFPSSGGVDTALTVQIIGKNTHWSDVGRALSVDFGDDIEVMDLVVQADELLLVHLIIAAAADLGRRDVTILGGAEPLLLEEAFLVQTGGIVLSPSRASIGQELWVQVYGSNTRFSAGSTFVALGTDNSAIRVLDMEVSAPDRMRFRINIGLEAQVGAYDVFVYNGPEVWTAERAFRVDRGGLRLALFPSEGRQGDSVDFEITGVNTHFSQIDTEIMLDPRPCLPSTCQLRVTRMNVLDSETIRGTVQISNGAQLGIRDLVVSTGDEILRLPDAFDVLAGARSCREEARASAYFGVVRNYRSDGSLRERVLASVMFYMSLDPPCIPNVSGGGGVSPYDAPGAFDSSSSEGRCPPSPTCDAGPFVYLYNDDQTITLQRYYDPIYARYYYREADVLSVEDFHFDTQYGLRAEGVSDPDGIPPFEVERVMHTPRRDMHLLEPDFSIRNPVQLTDEALSVRWTPADTYPDGRIINYFQVSPSSGSGRPRYLIVFPWDDGEWDWEPTWLQQVPTGSAYMSHTATAGTVIWQLPYQEEPLSCFGSSNLRWYGYMSLLDP